MVPSKWLEKYNFEIEEAIFDEKYLIIHLKDQSPMSLNSLTGMYKFLLNEFWSAVNDVNKSNVKFSVADFGRFKGRWCVSFPLKPHAFNVLKQIKHVADGDVFVLQMPDKPSRLLDSYLSPNFY